MLVISAIITRSLGPEYGSSHVKSLPYLINKGNTSGVIGPMQAATSSAQALKVTSKSGCLIYLVYPNKFTDPFTAKVYPRKITPAGPTSSRRIGPAIISTSTLRYRLSNKVYSPSSRLDQVLNRFIVCRLLQVGRGRKIILVTSLFTRLRSVRASRFYLSNN